MKIATSCTSDNKMDDEITKKELAAARKAELIRKEEREFQKKFDDSVNKLKPLVKLDETEPENLMDASIRAFKIGRELEVAAQILKDGNGIIKLYGRATFKKQPNGGRFMVDESVAGAEDDFSTGAVKRRRFAMKELYKKLKISQRTAYNYREYAAWVVGYEDPTQYTVEEGIELFTEEKRGRVTINPYKSYYQFLKESRPKKLNYGSILCKVLKLANKDLASLSEDNIIKRLHEFRLEDNKPPQ